MAYAQGTKVEIEQTRMDIERVLNRYGATSFSWHIEQRKACLQFETKGAAKDLGRRVRFDLPLLGDGTGGAKEAKARRERWRALLLCIKAKLEAVESQIETFEEAFLSHVVLADGGTVYHHIKDNIAISYQKGDLRPLLPPPGG